MKDKDKTKEQLINDLVELRQRVAELEASETERKRVEEALQASETRYQRLFESAQDLIYRIRISPTRRFEYVSPWATVITGYTPEEHYADPDLGFKLVHPDDRPLLESLARGDIPSGEPLVFRWVHKDGTVIWTEQRNVPVYDEAGNLVAIEGIARDITERKRAEEALRRERDLLSRVMETSPAGITVVNRQGEITFANGRAEQVLGLTRDEITHRTYNAPEWHITDYEGQPFLDEELPFQRVMATGQSIYDVRHAIEWPDGRRVFLSINAAPLFDESGQIDGMVAMVEDITERKQAEEALRESEDKYRQLFESESDAIFLIDNETGHILEANTAASVLYGYTREGLLGKKNSDLSAEPEETRRVTQTTLVSADRVVVVPLRFHRKKDGTMFPVEITGRFFTWRGRPVHIAAIRDITERKRAEEALQHRTRDLELLHRASRAFGSILDLDQVLATVLEEVRQLLGAVASSAWLVDPETGELVCHQATGLKSEAVRGWRLAPGEGIVGWVASHGGNLIVPDTQADERYFRGTAQRIGLDLRSILAVPLRVKQKVIGVLEVMDTEVGRFNPTHLTLLELLAASAAIAIENARLFERERVQRELAEALEEAAAAVSSTLDLDRVLDRILEQVEQVVAGDAFSMILIEDGAARVARWRGYQLPAEETRPSRFEIPITKYPNLMKMARMGRPIVVQDTSVTSEWVPAARDQGWRRSYVGAPIQVGGVTVGFLNVSGTRPGQFGPDDAQRLQAFANHAATAIGNARLYEQARQDAETKSVLLHEVNHRVKNNLSAIIGLLYAEQRYTRTEDLSAYRGMGEDLANRIRGLARVHDMLSAAEWAPLPLDELARQIIHVALRMLPRDKRISVDVTPSSVRVTPKQANSLALVINELATNTVKYALPERHMAHIGVCMALEDDAVLFEFRDDGPGYPKDVLQLERHNVGLYLIQTMVREGLGGELVLHNDRGAVTTIRFRKAPSGFRNPKGLRNK